MKIMRVIFYVLLITATLVVAFGAYYAYYSLARPNPATAVVYIPKGQSVRAIVAQLVAAGVISERYVFEAYLRVTGLADKLKAGEYEIATGITPPQVADKIAQGKTKPYQFTVPEGLGLRGACKIIAATGKGSQEECLAQARDVTLLPGATGFKSLEGYLYPETYTYDSQTTLKQLVAAMPALFDKKVDAARREMASALGMSLHEVVTLASVVEKETGKADERSLIAGVFANRLKIGMPLQSDPTVIYGIPDFDGNLTRAQLETDTPYNTYTHSGLPAGPICSPGLASIDAVLHPAATPALYFVAQGDGSHYFSATLAEHNRAVRYYQLKQGSPP